MSFFSIKINKSNMKKSLFIMCILIPFLMPGGLTSIPISGFENANIFFHALKIVSILLYLICEHNAFAFYNKQIFAMVLLYGLALAVTNFIHELDILSLRTLIFFPMLVLICMHYIYNNTKAFFSALACVLGIYNLAQIVTVINYFPHGFTHYTGYFWADTLAGARYFFGTKNQAISYMLAFLMAVVIKEYIKGNMNTKRIYFYAFAFAIEAYVLDSANTIFCIGVFILFYLIASGKLYKMTPFLFEPRFYILFTVVVFFLICVFAKVPNFPLINLALKALGRNSTFTNRTLIWQITLQYFISNPIIGVGEIAFTVLNSVQVQAHNTYLDVLYKYGIIGFLPYFGIIISTEKMLNRFKNNYIGVVCIGILFIILIHNCFDTMDDYVFILFMVVFCNIDKLVLKNSEQILNYNHSPIGTV